MEALNLKNCYVEYITKNPTTIDVKLHTPIFDILFCFKYKRRSNVVCPVYMYLGNQEKPYLERIYLHAYDGKLPNLDDYREWSIITMNLLRFKVSRLLYTIFEDSVLNSLYYQMTNKYEKPCKTKRKRLWE